MEKKGIIGYLAQDPAELQLRVLFHSNLSHSDDPRCYQKLPAPVRMSLLLAAPLLGCGLATLGQSPDLPLESSGPDEWSS